MCVDESAIQSAMDQVADHMRELGSEVTNAQGQIASMDIDPMAGASLVAIALQVINPRMEDMERVMMALTILMVDSIAAARVAEGLPITTEHVENSGVDMSAFEDLFNDEPEIGGDN